MKIYILIILRKRGFPLQPQRPRVSSHSPFLLVIIPSVMGTCSMITNCIKLLLWPKMIYHASPGIRTALYATYLLIAHTLQGNCEKAIHITITDTYDYRLRLIDYRFPLMSSNGPR